MRNFTVRLGADLVEHVTAEFAEESNGNLTFVVYREDSDFVPVAIYKQWISFIEDEYIGKKCS